MMLLEHAGQDGETLSLLTVTFLCSSLNSERLSILTLNILKDFFPDTLYVRKN